MAKLSVYLTPFASDYTGVSAALYDLNALVVINDATCCTSNYIYYDEPRWNDSTRPTFSAQLRDIDAILGNDELVISSTLDAISDTNSELVALIGTPVPAIIGMDMQGIADEVEFRSGKPTLGFSTTGFDYYDQGLYLAGKELINLYTNPSKTNAQRLSRHVNIVGMSHLDYARQESSELLASYLEDNGWSVIANLFSGLTIDQIRGIPHAELNLAVSSAGVQLARLLKKKFGTPYVAMAPLTVPYVEQKMQELTLEKSAVQPSANCNDLADEKILIVSDQIIGNSLRDVLVQRGIKRTITVASFFGWDSELAQNQDLHIESESELIKHVKSTSYSAIIGDPVLMEIPNIKDANFYELVHPAVSGQLYLDQAKTFMHEEFDLWLDALIS